MKITMFNGQIHQNWPFSIAMFNYRKVKSKAIIPCPDWLHMLQSSKQCPLGSGKQLVISYYYVGFHTANAGIPKWMVHDGRLYLNG